MKNYFLKIKTYVVAHKIISAVVLIVILFIGNWGYKKLTSTAGETRYVLSKVTKGTIVSSVTGSGQVSALNQLDIKPKVSGPITYVAVAPGDKVTSGQLLFSIDSIDAQKAVRDAEISLKSAQLSLDKLKIQNSSENTTANLTKAYSNGFSAVASTFLDLSPTISGIENILKNNNLSDNAARNSGNTAINYKKLIDTGYDEAKIAYNKNKTDFGTLNYNSAQGDIDAIIIETYNTAQLLATVIKNINEYVNYLAYDTGRPSDFASYQTTLSEYTNTLNSHISALSTAETNIKTEKDSLPSTDIDLQSQQLSLTQKENALQDAKDNLSYYYVRAPFSGTIASVPVQKGDNVSSGTTVATIITSQQVATISLNEVDIAKIQLGQKATLTFDAVADLKITGKVAQIDSIGTVSQGVVNYNVKISFDTTDERIKPGMSVSAAIITNIKQDVLIAPNSAVKNQNGSAYVEMFDNALPAPLAGVQGSPSATPPRQQDVTVGISNDTSTEIISGIKEGDEIVTKTILPTTTTMTAPSIFGSATNRSGANATRIGTGR
jgi:HlyD family secretion protein